jgi:predicted nucleic acid-binding protein
VIFAVDASVALKWFLSEAPDEQDVRQALTLIQGIRSGQHTILQPPHWMAEVLGVLVRRAPNAASEALAKMRSLDPETVVDDAVYLRAAELSRRLKHHLFDTLYHAVALERGATLVTADERYFNVAKDDGAIQLLKDFAAA